MDSFNQSEQVMKTDLIRSVCHHHYLLPADCSSLLNPNSSKFMKIHKDSVPSKIKVFDWLISDLYSCGSINCNCLKCRNRYGVVISREQTCKIFRTYFRTFLAIWSFMTFWSVTTSRSWTRFFFFSSFLLFTFLKFILRVPLWVEI